MDCNPNPEWIGLSRPHLQFRGEGERPYFNDILDNYPQCGPRHSFTVSGHDGRDRIKLPNSEQPSLCGPNNFGSMPPGTLPHTELISGDTFGTINGDVFFLHSSVSGEQLKLGDKVVGEIFPVEGMSFQFNAKRVQLVSQQQQLREQLLLQQLLQRNPAPPVPPNHVNVGPSPSTRALDIDRFLNERKLCEIEKQRKQLVAKKQVLESEMKKNKINHIMSNSELDSSRREENVLFQEEEIAYHFRGSEGCVKRLEIDGLPFTSPTTISNALNLNSSNTAQDSVNTSLNVSPVVEISDELKLGRNRAKRLRKKMNRITTNKEREEAGLPKIVRKKNRGLKRRVRGQLFGVTQSQTI